MKVKYPNEEEPVEVSTKDYLYDYAETGMEWFWNHYGHNEEVIDYLDKVGNSFVGGKGTVLGGTRSKVIPGFKSFLAYSTMKGFKETPYMRPEKRLKPSPPWDKTVPNKRTRKNDKRAKGAQESETVPLSKRKKAPPTADEDNVNTDKEATTESDGNLVTHAGGEEPLLEPGKDGEPGKDEVTDCQGPEKDGVGPFIVAEEPGQAPPDVEDLGQAGGDSNGVDNNDVAVADAISGTEENKDAGEVAVTANNVTTPVRKERRAGRVELTTSPEKPCVPPKNHNWEYYDDPSYCVTGTLMTGGGNTCIGRRGGVVCGKLFVPTINQLNQIGVQGAYRISFKTPAYGCKDCWRAMCKPCHDYYEANERVPSPPRYRGAA